jgi:hypothetical protein
MAKSAREVFENVGALIKRVEIGKAAGDEADTSLREMTADEFLEHAAGEMAKCETDPPARALKRLRVLSKAVGICKALVWESTTTAKVPVMNDSTTSDKDKSEKEGTFTPTQSAATLFSGNSAAEWTAKMNKRLNALKKSDGDPSENEDEAKKAQWTTKYVNDLPDSSFLYIEPGAGKDGGGKTEPRAKRHFPVKDADGKVDVAHVRNAIARIPQSDAPGLDATKKKDLQDKARKLLEESKKRLGKRGAVDSELWPADVVAGGGGEGDWGADDES